MVRQVVVEFRDVGKVYRMGWRRRGVRALDRVNWSIHAGEVVGLLGPNRAGKTTLLKVLLSLCRPTEGRVLRLGRPGTDRRTLARVGFVHENQALPRYLSPQALLEYYGALTLVPYEDVKRRVPRLLERVGLSDRAREPIAGFSRGMTQRLALAQALINDPELLVLDEPAQGLDVEGRRILHELIHDLRRRGRTVLLVSHILDEVESLCDRIGMLVAGRLVYAGSLTTLVQPSSAESRQPLERAFDRLIAQLPNGDVTARARVLSPV